MSTYGILPNGKQQFVDSNGNPLAAGKVYYYIPNTTTFKNTYQDDSGSVTNTNPVNLDANGQCVAYGFGSYRQQVYDANNNLIWDLNVDAPLSSANLSLASFSIKEVGTKLFIYYNNTAIASFDSSGNFIAAGNVSGGQTP